MDSRKDLSFGFQFGYRDNIMMNYISCLIKLQDILCKYSHTNTKNLVYSRAIFAEIQYFF